MNEVLDLPRIHTLPRQLANQIAAGEVVERPASVVKELLENAIDARADRIRIDLDRGGIARIRISDNGHGIHPDDLGLALDRHSTSKLATEEDLQHIQSLGFRGEALGAIASVSRLSIHTASDPDGQGRCLQSNGSHIDAITPVAHKPGTTVEVRDLFFNTPARRKFLRTEWTEYQHVQTVIKQIALSHFEISFTVYHNGRRVMYFPAATTEYIRRVSDVLGKGFVKHAQPLDCSCGALRLWGWLGEPSIARNQTDRQYIYLNGRSIRDKQVNHAIRIAFSDRIYPGRYPCYVLLLEMEPNLADVNVHPAKHEVRFSHARDVHDFIHASVLQALNGSLARTMYNDGQEQTRTGEEASDDFMAQVQERSDNVIRNRNVPLSEPAPTELGDIKCVIHNRFLILENAGGMTLLDLHMARKKMAEITLAALRNGSVPEPRPLLFPVSVRFSSGWLDQLEGHADKLARLGIDLARQAPDLLTLKQLPHFLKYAQPESLLMDLAKILNNPTCHEPEIHSVLLDHVNDRSDQMDETEIRKMISTITEGEDARLQIQSLWRRFDEQGLLSLLLKK